MMKLLAFLLLLMNCTELQSVSIFECIFNQHKLAHLTQNTDVKYKSILKSLEIRSPLESKKKLNVITAEVEGSPLGFLSFKQTDNELELVDVFVYSESRGNKIGTNLLEQFSNRLSEPGVDSLSVKLPKDKPETLSLFLKNGFHLDEGQSLAREGKTVKLVKSGQGNELLQSDRLALSNFLKINQLKAVQEKPGLSSLYKHIWENKSAREAKKYFKILDEIPEQLQEKLQSSKSFFDLQLLIKASDLNEVKLKEAIELLANEKLIKKLTPASEAYAYLKNESLIDKILENSEGDILKSAKEVLDKIRPGLPKLLKQYRPKRTAIKKYNEVLSKSLDKFETAEDLKKTLLGLKSEVSQVFSKDKHVFINKQIDDIVENLTEDSFKSLKNNNINESIDDLLLDPAKLPSRLQQVAAKPEGEKWLKSLFSDCRKNTAINIKSCLNRVMDDLKGSGKKAFSPFSKTFKKHFPCLSANPVLLADTFLFLGFFGYLNYSTFKDAGKEEGVPEEDRWREIPWEYFVAAFSFAFHGSEYSCAAAKSQTGTRQFGKVIDPTATEVTKKTSFLKRAKNLIGLNIAYVTSLSAFQILADHALDRQKKRSIQQMLLEYPGKLLYFGIWGSVKNIAITKYVKNSFVPWVTRTFLPKAMKDSAIAQLLVMIPTVRIGIGKLSLLDLKYVGEKMFFPLGEIVAASLFKKTNPEKLKDLPEKEREYIENADKALTEALAETGLTLDDLEISKDEDGKVKLSIAEAKHQQVLEKEKNLIK